MRSTAFSVRHSGGEEDARWTAPDAKSAHALPIAGYASLFGVRDLGGDVVARGAFADSLARRGSLPMLRQHGAPPVGVWDAAREDGRGLFVRGRIDISTPDGRVAAALHKAGVLDGLSIGYRARRARAEGRLRVLSQVDLFEVSLVSFPMLPAARFTIAPSPLAGEGRGPRS